MILAQFDKILPNLTFYNICQIDNLAAQKNSLLKGLTIRCQCFPSSSYNLQTNMPPPPNFLNTGDWLKHF